MRTLLWILIICVSVFSDGAMANDEGLDFQLQVAGNNRPEIQKALDLIPPEQKEGMRFLVRHMQEQDLQTLTSEFLIENTRLAYQARERAAWKIPDDLFLNYVLPYSNVDEERDPWRKELFDLSAPIVVDCTTTTCATQNLNQLLFQKVGVQYSTKRKKANQSPKESIDQGLASCTGLSILLVDACRSVGVPARLVGIPSWKNKRGNHTWVEIWDDGWHFTGAAEYDSNGLNRAWFQNDAALADADSVMHSIYAVSFKKTDTRFPLVWSNRLKIHAVNVTKRYQKSNQRGADSSKVSTMIRVWNQEKTSRRNVKISVYTSKGVQVGSGLTRGDTADMNDMISFQLEPEQDYLCKIYNKDSSALLTTKSLRTTSYRNQVFDWALAD